MSDIESNCSENISNRDELTATELRKYNGATKHAWVSGLKIDFILELF